MKKIILLFLFATIVRTVCFSRGNERVTFYRVPLVCPAATQIGCGSRAKPILLELENKKDVVAEAWLNRAGTVIAIVWENNASDGIRRETAKNIFSKNQLEAKSVSGKEQQELLKGFAERENWYRGADVDQLSIEEASVIAQRYVNLALEQKWITQEEADSIKPDVENYFKTELVKTRTREELNNDDINKFRQDVVTLFVKHIGKEKTDEVMEMYRKWEEGCEKNDSSKCCEPKNKKSKNCCEKSKAEILK